MTDLVNPAAIDAAERAYTDGWNLHTSDKIRGVVEAAAPFIAAEALRQAADQLGKFEKESSRDGYVVAVSTAVSYLSGKADELEADAAFTGMVQLGQEIGDE